MSTRSRRILALDLGTRTGWALRTDTGIDGSGAWKLPSAEPGRAYSEFFERLTDEVRLSRPTFLAYEDVPARAHRGGDAAHRWGGFESLVLVAARWNDVRVVPVPIQSWKKYAGLPAASGPDEALAACRGLHPEVRSPDQAVAIFVAHTAWEMERRC